MQNIWSHHCFGLFDNALQSTGVFFHSGVSLWSVEHAIQRWKDYFRVCASFVQLNVVLMLKLLLPSKTVKTSWIRRTPIGKLETFPSQEKEKLLSMWGNTGGCGGFNTICGVSGAYKLLSVVVGSNIHTLNRGNHSAGKCLNISLKQKKNINKSTKESTLGSIMWQSVNFDTGL